MSEFQRRHTIKKIILGYILGLATLFGVAYATSAPEPSVGLYWYANVDPTVGAGVSAPQYQLLIRTDTQAIYWKSGPASTAWTKIAGTGAGGSVTSITCGANGGLLCSPNPITTTGTISVAQLLTIPNEQINTETATELDNYDPWHAGPHTSRVEIDPTQPNLLITGIVAGNDGDMLWLWNGGNGGTNPNTITLPSQSSSSTGLNRFWIADGKLVNIPNNDGVLLIYDGAFGWTCFSCATSILRAQELSVDPVATPTALTAGSSTNNYNPWAGLLSPTSYVQQNVTGTGTATITGIDAAGAPNSEGRVLIWHNTSTTASTQFLSSSGSSSAANQLIGPNNLPITIPPLGTIMFVYDANEDAWRMHAWSTSLSDNGATVSTPEAFAVAPGVSSISGLLGPVTIEGVSSAFLSIAVPSGGAKGVVFGNSSSAFDGGVFYDAIAQVMELRANGNADRMTLSSTDVTAVGVPFQLGASGPTWSSGTSAPTGACTTGSTYSVTTSSANPANYVCANSAWNYVTTGAVERNAVYFGPGGDGTITFDGTSTVLGIVPSASTYTLTRDIAPSNMTVNAGVTIATANYMISVSNILNNNGTISNNGQAGSHGSGGNTTPAGRFPININGGQGGGTGGGGAKAPLGFFVSAAAANGGTAGNNGANGTNGAGNGGGGGGATSGAGSTGGAQAVGTLVPSFDDYLRGAHTSDGVAMSFGTGGGAGGNGSSLNGYGGAGGSIVLIAAATIKSTGATGAIQARGGAGGTAVASDNAGGGGGGGGGVVVLVYNTGANTQVVDEDGGAGGLGSTGDPTGKGGNGGNGVTYALNLSGDGT